MEIDESKFGKRKFNRGRRVDGVWVLGGIDRTTRETFFKVVPDRSAATMLPIIIANVHPETTIMSDCWRAYARLEDHFIMHSTVNHKINFVDRDDPNVHTNLIESTWRVLKRTILPKNGTRKNLYPGYFAFYCIKKRYLEHSVCPFRAFLDLVKRVYPLNVSENPPFEIGKKQAISSRQSRSRPISLRLHKRPHVALDLESDKDSQ